MKDIIIQTSLRILVAAIPLLIIIHKKLDNSSGNTGMASDLPVMISFSTLLIWGLFMTYQIGYSFYNGNQRSAFINLLVFILALFVFIYAGGI